MGSVDSGGDLPPDLVWLPEPTSGVEHHRFEHRGQWWPVHVAPALGLSPRGDAGNPMLVILDGDWAMGSVVAAMRWLHNEGQLEPVTVVGIGSRSRGDNDAVLRERVRDYTPKPPPGWKLPNFYRGSPVGEADRLAEAMTLSILPTVRHHYPTSGPVVLFGHSIAGLFVLTMLGRHSSAFTGYIVSSPSMWWGEGEFLQTIEPVGPSSVVLTVGEFEDAPDLMMRRGAGQVWSTLQRLDAVQLYSYEIPLEHHLGAERTALTLGAQILFDGPRQPTLRRRLGRRRL